MLLLTGFEPFGGLERNPSGEMARILDGEEGVRGVQLPVSYSRIGGALREILADPWDAVVLMGVAVLRPQFTLEKVAINFGDPQRPDNEGHAPPDGCLVPGGPDAYFTTLPIERLADALNEEGVPASVSYTAGPYLCNASMYHARHMLDARGTPAGFIHIPRTPDMPGEGEPMDLETQLRGVRRVIRELT